MEIERDSKEKGLLFEQCQKRLNGNEIKKKYKKCGSLRRSITNWD